LKKESLSANLLGSPQRSEVTAAVESPAPAVGLPVEAPPQAVKITLVATTSEKVVRNFDGMDTFIVKNLFKIIQKIWVFNALLALANISEPILTQNG
jgi:hypothetical protein